LPCGARRKKENAAIGSSASKSGLSQSENAFRCCRCVVADESDVQSHVSMDGLIRQIGILPEWTAKSTSLLGRWRQIDEKGSWQGLLKASGVPALVIPLLISTPVSVKSVELQSHLRSCPAFVTGSRSLSTSLQCAGHRTRYRVRARQGRRSEEAVPHASETFSRLLTLAPPSSHQVT
jgi:hypothetical protein